MCRAGTATACRSNGRSRRRITAPRARPSRISPIPRRWSHSARSAAQFAQHWIDVQRAEFIRLGVVGDWAHPYTTMSFPAEAQIARELMKFAANGTLYRGSKPVMWSVVEKTALAEAEVEYEDYTSDTVWVKFPIADVDGLASSSCIARIARRSTICDEASSLSGRPRLGRFRATARSAIRRQIEYGLYQVVDAPTDNWAKRRRSFCSRRQAGARRPASGAGHGLSSGLWTASMPAESSRWLTVRIRSRACRRLRFQGAASCRRSCHRRCRHRLRAHRARTWPRGL